MQRELTSEVVRWRAFTGLEPAFTNGRFGMRSDWYKTVSAEQVCHGFGTKVVLNGMLARVDSCNVGSNRLTN